MRPLALLALSLLLTACGDGQPFSPPDALLPDGSVYHGALLEGRLHGPGSIKHPDGSGYQGTFLNGLRHGQGTWQSAAGEHYQGAFANGRFDGLGVFTDSNGNRYEGAFKDGRFHGLGELRRADGSRHQGHFKRGEPDGQGVRSDAEGMQLSGTFRAGQLQGQGSLSSADNSHYSGGFANDLFHGDGRFQSAAGDTWHGHFRKGSATGAGEYQGVDGEHYRGNFRQWRYHGQGQLSLPDGRHYQGQFRNGRIHGEGRMTYPDGRVEEGLWRDAERVRDAAGKHLSDSLEQALLNQGSLLQASLDAVPASTAQAELYALVLAGDGSQSVFRREADYVSQLLREEFQARGVISLVNHRENLADRPMATRENLRLAIQTLARNSGPEDLLFIYLTSHGSADHQLMLNQPRLQLRNLPAADLAELLTPLHERNTVVVISACYSGGFIEQLKNQHTLVMTAARADRTSFGCSEQSQFTYFGRALFTQALTQTDDLETAFALARQHVSEQEQAEGFEPSEPQIWAPPQVLQHWQAMRHQASAASTQQTPPGH